MQILIPVIETALPVFTAILLGVFCRSKSFLTRDGIDALKKVVINLTLPFVLLNAFATAQYSVQTIVLPVVMFLVCCVALLLGFVVCKICRVSGRLTPFLASGFEAGMLGYALFALLFPDVSISNFAIIDIGQTLFVFTLFKTLLSGKGNWKAILKDMATTPILWATFAGVLIGATGLYGVLEHYQIAGIMNSLTGFLSAPTGTIILLTVGYDLVIRQIPWRQVSGFIVMRLAIMAVCVAGIIVINRTLLGGLIFEGAAILMCILPPPYVIPVFADEPAERGRIAGSLSALTLVTIILFAIYAIVINTI